MKRTTLFSQITGLLIVSLLSIVACEWGIQPQDDQPSGARIRINQSITGIVVGSPNFTLLRTAVVRAGLAGALATGNLTVFAPTDAAFQAAGFADANAINNVNVDALRRILLYHVIGNRFPAQNLSRTLTGYTTLLNEQVQVVNGQSISVNGIFVQQANMQATNGIIHVINRVLLPPAGNLVEAAVANPNLTYLVAALQRAGLVQTIGTGGPFTVFAPTNAAFQAAGFPTIASIQAASPAALARILTYHVVSGRAFSSTLRSGEVHTLQGQVMVSVGMNQSATVKGNSNATASNVTAADLVALNGVVHVIDQVLLP